MMETQRYVRKPLYVDVVRVTNANFDEVVAWSKGEVKQNEVSGKGTSRKYIQIDVHNPKNERQQRAFVGDWVLYTPRGFKIYTNKAFQSAFDLVEPFDKIVAKARQEETLAQGVVTAPVPIENAEPEQTWTGDEAGPILPQPSGSEEHPEQYLYDKPYQPSPAMEQAVKTIEDEGGTVEVATPQGIADVVAENQPDMVIKQADGTTVIADFKTEADRETIPVDDGIELADSPTAPPVQVDDGRRVLSKEEQAGMGSEELRELLKSGEVVLEQDLAA